MEDKKNDELKKSEQYDEDYFEKNKDIINEISLNETMLRKDPQKFNDDPTLILYKLPLSDKLREKLYYQLINEHNQIK